jgi:hypothetical protein
MGQVGIVLGVWGEAFTCFVPPIEYRSLTPANTADLCLSKELLGEADLGGEVARKLLGDLAYRSGELKEELAELGIVLLTKEASASGLG